VVETYTDHGISGAKGRDQRPGLDQLLRNANRRKFDIVMCWAIDRLGRRRSLSRTAKHRHHDPSRQAYVSSLRCFCRVRAQHDPPTGEAWPQARGR
jgi:hypothetical protein